VAVGETAEGGACVPPSWAFAMLPYLQHVVEALTAAGLA
jgi:hypothetical protein